MKLFEQRYLILFERHGIVPTKDKMICYEVFCLDCALRNNPLCSVHTHGNITEEEYNELLMKYPENFI